MLAARAEALKDEDAAGYLKPLNETARTFELPIAQGAAAIPIESAEFSVRSAKSSSRDSFRSLPADLVYRYERLPADNPFRIAFVLDVDLQDRRWTITSSSVAADTFLPIWATGPAEVATSEHFLALHRPGLADTTPVLNEAEQARAQLAPKLDFEMDQVALVLLAKDAAEYAAMSARGAPVSAVAQAETTFALSPDRIAAEARLILVNLQKTREGDAIETLQHELGHLALARYTRPFTPAWVGESAAMYLAGTRPVAAWRDGIRRGSFKDLSFQQLNTRLSFNDHEHSSAALTSEYAYSAAAAWYLVETFGSIQFWTFYRSYSELTPAEVYSRLPDGGTGPAAQEALAQLASTTTEQSLRRIFNLTPAQLDAQVKAWMKSET